LTSCPAISEKAKRHLKMQKLKIILITIVVLGIAGYVAYHQIDRHQQKRLDTALERERNEWWDNIGKLEEKVAELEQELAQERGASVPKEKLNEVFGQSPTVVAPENEETDCDELQRQMTAFFTYLDKQDYILSHGLEGGTRNLFQQVVKELSENPPLVTGEMRDFSSLISNVAHLYRVLGREQLELITEIMEHESEIMESVTATFFEWATSGDRCQDQVNGPPSLQVLYKYAGFFLNTLAGRSYLLRRNSKIRILTAYYSVLILDKANQETLNPYGIDIRPFIDASLYDVSNQRGLIHRKEYQGKLEAMRRHYEMKNLGARVFTP
jgi:Tfp pilus assembly protein PilO